MNIYNDIYLQRLLYVKPGQHVLQQFSAANDADKVARVRVRGHHDVSGFRFRIVPAWWTVFTLD